MDNIALTIDNEILVLQNRIKLGHIKEVKITNKEYMLYHSERNTRCKPYKFTLKFPYTELTSKEIIKMVNRSLINNELSYIESVYCKQYNLEDDKVNGLVLYLIRHNY